MLLPSIGSGLFGEQQLRAQLALNITCKLCVLDCVFDIGHEHGLEHQLFGKVPHKWLVQGAYEVKHYFDTAIILIQRILIPHNHMCIMQKFNCVAGAQNVVCHSTLKMISKTTFSWNNKKRSDSRLKLLRNTIKM